MEMNESKVRELKSIIEKLKRVDFSFQPKIYHVITYKTNDLLYNKIYNIHNTVRRGPKINTN